MSFSLEKLFVNVFAPQTGEIVTVMYDLPHDDIFDNQEWQDRRQMAEEWHGEISRFADQHGLRVAPIVTYAATGGHNQDLPEHGTQAGQEVWLEDVAAGSTIIISMPEFSASAPLLGWTGKYPQLRAASMPHVTRGMQETGLSADYDQIARSCAQLAPLFDRADGIEVTFSTGDSCYFDKSDHRPARQDTGRLHPGAAPSGRRMANLPAGEVFVTPNETAQSRTKGRIPVRYGSELVVFVVEGNQIVDVQGSGQRAAADRREFQAEKARRNIAEVAIGCNERAVVTGNVLEDEKAGFHWAYGRSEHLGGTVGPNDFTSPDRVVHHDIVYARGNPIVCQQLDFVFPDGKRQTVIREGVLELPN